MEITLIPLMEEHIEMVRIWRNLPEISQFMYTEDEISPQEQKQWFQRIKNDDSQKYWIVGYQNEMFGVVSLYQIKPRFKTCYWAFYLDRRSMLKKLGNAEFVNSNIGPKVEYAILENVFEEMQFNKLACEVFSTNQAVINMHEKFGFRREAYFREHIYKNNMFHDVVSLAYLKSEWEINKDSLHKKVF